jgi:hypothetical protein
MPRDLVAGQREFYYEVVESNPVMECETAVGLSM